LTNKDDFRLGLRVARHRFGSTLHITDPSTEVLFFCGGLLSPPGACSFVIT